MMITTLSRRDALGLGLAVVTIGAVGGVPIPSARAAENKAEELMKQFAAGKEAMEGKIKLDLPEIAENGNTVPMSISVDSPMTQESFVSEVLVVADGNPNPGVITFRFSPTSGVAEASTRIRLAKTQKVTALAKMNDGSVYMASQEVKVTIGGCGG